MCLLADTPPPRTAFLHPVGPLILFLSFPNDTVPTVPSTPQPLPHQPPCPQRGLLKCHQLEELITWQNLSADTPRRCGTPFTLDDALAIRLACPLLRVAQVQIDAPAPLLRAAAEALPGPLWLDCTVPTEADLSAAFASLDLDPPLLSPGGGGGLPPSVVALRFLPPLTLCVCFPAPLCHPHTLRSRSVTPIGTLIGCVWRPKKRL